MSSPMNSRPGQGPGLVLVANDHEWTARSVETILVAAGHRVVRTFTGEETLKVAEERLPDAFILDHQLPDFSGLDVCRKLRSDPRFGASTPIILTTAGPSGRAQRLAAYEAGAWEFYGQPLDGQALLHKIRAYLAARREVTRITMAGLVDPETMLYSRIGLVRRMEELASDARRRGETIACVAVSVSGDERSSWVSDLLLKTARTADAKGRLGPNSFAVVGTTDARGAGRLADRIRAAIGDYAGELRVVVTTPSSALPDEFDPNAFLSEASNKLAAAA